MNEDLERLKKELNPTEPINIVDQCRIVSEALAVGGDFQGQRQALADYLGISNNHVYKMKYSNDNALPELKEWFKDIECGVYSYYDKAKLAEESQRVWLHAEHVLRTGDYLCLSQTIIKEKEQ